MKPNLKKTVPPDKDPGHPNIRLVRKPGGTRPPATSEPPSRGIPLTVADLMSGSGSSPRPNWIAVENCLRTECRIPKRSQLLDYRIARRRIHCALLRGIRVTATGSSGAFCVLGVTLGPDDEPVTRTLFRLPLQAPDIAGLHHLAGELMDYIVEPLIDRLMVVDGLAGKNHERLLIGLSKLNN